MKNHIFPSAIIRAAKLTALLLILLSPVQIVFAQALPDDPQTTPVLPKEGTVTGRVIDNSTRVPMEYANVSIFSQPGAKLITGGISKANGSFSLSNLPFGIYYLEASFIGFEKTVISNIRLTPETAVVNLGDLALDAASEQIGAVEVIGERNRVEYQIDKKVINVTNDLNASGGSAATVLENTPSVEVDIDGNVSLRGSSSFTVLIDGRPSVLSGSDALRQIPAAAIRNIEIITNPSVKYDPDGMAGIINVVMKRNVITGLNGIVTLNLGTGDKYSTDFLLNYKTQKYNLFLGGNWNDENNKGHLSSDRATFANDTTYLFTDGPTNQSRTGKQIKGGFDFYPGKNSSVTLSAELGQYGFGRSEQMNMHEYVSSGATDSYSVQLAQDGRNGDFFSTNAAFLTKFNPNGTHKLEGSFNYRTRTGDSEESQDEYYADQYYTPTGQFLSRVISREEDDEANYRLKLDYTLPLGEERILEAGLQSRIESEEESLDFLDFNPTTQQFENNEDFTSSMEFKEDIHSLYTTYSGKVKQLKFLTGIRGEYNKRSTIHYRRELPTSYSLDRFDFFPSLHLSWETGAEGELMASYSRRINRPGGRELDPFPGYINRFTIRTGNPDLKPEYTNSLEFSYLKKFGNSFVSLETFYRTTNNLITNVDKQVDQILYLSTENLNRDHSMGTELMGNLNFTDWLLVNASFTLYNYQLKGEILGKSIDRQSTNYSGRLNTTVKFSPDSRLQLTGFYRGPSVSAQGEQKGMAFLNLSFRQELLQKKLTATLSVRDLLGTMRREGSSYGDNFRSNFRMTREPRVLMLTLSYKINNFKVNRESAPEDEEPSFGEEE